MNWQMMRWIGGGNLVLVFCVVALVGAAVYSLFAPAPQTPELTVASEKRAVIDGVIVADPDLREKTTRLTVRPEAVNGEAFRSRTKVIVSADRFADVRYGDRIRATGTLKTPELFETDSARTFDYPMYLRAHGVSHEMSFADVSVIGRGEGNPFVAALLSVKHLLNRGIQTALPEPESALLSGLLLGEKQSLGEALTEAFRKAGIVHIIVLSGYNVALVIRFLSLFAERLLPRTAAIGVSMVGVVVFAIMTGASETTIRASAMALLVLIARLLYRPQLSLRLLLIAAAGMALWNPFLVLFDLSYQLSILATFGLILFSDRIAGRIRFITERFGLREVVATTLATQITVLPLLVLSIGQVSAVFLPTNALVLSVVPFAMLFGFIASVLSLISSALAFPVIAVSYGLLAYIIAVGDFFGSLPFAAFDVPQGWTLPVLVCLSAMYVFCFAYLSAKRKSP